MKIKIRYENHLTTIDVPEEDFTVMVQTDFDERRAVSDDPDAVQPRSRQEIVEEQFNKPDYNGWHRHWRHTDEDARPARLDHKADSLPADIEAEPEPHHFTLDEFPDMTLPVEMELCDSYRDQCALLRRKLKPDYAEMLIAIHLDGYSINDYVARIGDDPNNVSHRLKRAEKKLRDILKKRPI